MTQWQAWIDRWNALFPESPTVDTKLHLELPLALSVRFSYALFHCCNKSFLAVLDEKGDTPLNYLNYRKAIEQHTLLPIIYFITKLPNYQYGRLIDNQIPFISQSGYVYIPQLFINLPPIKVTNTLTPLKREMFSPAAQTIILRHLLFRDIHGKSLRRIASILKNYSPMSIGNAKEELEEKGLCSYEGASTRGRLEFNIEDENLWRMAKPFLKSPVQRIRYIRSEVDLSHLPFSGESALSMQTLLGEPMLPTYAVGKTQIKSFLAAPGIKEVDEEYANVIIEHWRYTPECLMKPNDAYVDKLSLYLSLCNSEDDRVIQELNKLILP